jgi:hypothetical protein
MVHVNRTGRTLGHASAPLPLASPTPFVFPGPPPFAFSGPSTSSASAYTPFIWGRWARACSTCCVWGLGRAGGEVALLPSLVLLNHLSPYHHAATDKLDEQEDKTEAGGQALSCEEELEH